MIAVEAVLRAMIERTDQLIVSASQRQASEVLQKCRRVADLLERLPSLDSLPAALDSFSKSELKFSNGARVLSLPQNPATIRGFTGNVYLDEFAHHREDAAVYEAVAPAVTRGHRLTVLSTPLGQSGLFYEIWSDTARYPEFARFRLTITEAVAAGLTADIGALRRTFGDESFRQEFLCEFIDEATAFFPYALIRACIGEPAAPADAPRFIGIDVGRKRDLTCLHVLARAGDTLITCRREELKDMPFEDQRAVIASVIREENCAGGMIDATGIGMPLAEELNKEFGFVEPLQFTSETKLRLVIGAKRKFEERRIRIPDESDLIADIHAIRRSVSPSQRLQFDAPRASRASGGGGHADRFWALALAIAAAEGEEQIEIRFL